jgi:hypothetical protein
MSDIAASHSITSSARPMSGREKAMPSALAVLKTEDHNHELAYGKTSPSSTLFFFDNPRETMECDWRI